MEGQAGLQRAAGRLEGKRGHLEEGPDPWVRSVVSPAFLCHLDPAADCLPGSIGMGWGVLASGMGHDWAVPALFLTIFRSSMAPDTEHVCNKDLLDASVEGRRKLSKGTQTPYSQWMLFALWKRMGEFPFAVVGFHLSRLPANQG